MAEVTDKPVIIGAGPGGATLAIALARAGQSCILLDKSSFPRDKICGDALSGKALEALRKVDRSIATAIGENPIQLPSWGVNFYAPNSGMLRLPFKSNFDKSALAPGHITKRVDFDDFLINYVKAESSVDFRENQNIRKIERLEKGFRLHFDDEIRQPLETPFVVGADGAQSVTAVQLGGYKLEPKHHCAAIRLYYEGVKDLDADNFIELHFLKGILPGYFWIFPLPNGQANVGLGMRSDIIAHKRVNLKIMLEEILQMPQFKTRFADAKALGPPRGFGLPLGSKKRRISGDNFLLLGDAASLIDPFTGEGIGNAMLSAVFAARVIAEKLPLKQTDAASLQAYDQLVYNRLWQELRLGKTLQQLSSQQWLFNLVVNKARRSPTLSSAISSMFDDVNLRKQLGNPLFYLKILFE